MYVPIYGKYVLLSLIRVYLYQIAIRFMFKIPHKIGSLLYINVLLFWHLLYKTWFNI